MSRRVPFFAGQGRVGPVPTFGEPQLTIMLELDANGLLRTNISKPVPAFTIIELLLDAIQGQREVIRKQASMIIDTSKPVKESEIDGQSGKEEKDNDGGGGSPG